MRSLRALVLRTNEPIATAALKACSSTFRKDRLYEALDMFHDMNNRGIAIDLHAYASLVQTCANMKALTEGKQIHAHVLKNGIDQTILVGTKLIILYTKCGSLTNARQVFDKMPKRNVLSWTVMIGGVARHGHWEEALTLFYQMQTAGMQPDNYIFPSVLKACANLAALQQGKDVHDYIVRAGFQSDVFVESALVDMYAKCGSLEYARQVFDKMSHRDLVAWNAMIAGYSQNGHAGEAMEMFHEMRLAGVKPDLITWNALIAGYSQSGHGDDAFELFCQMQSSGMMPDAISWTAMIAGYAQNGRGDEALKLFCQMQLAGFKPNSVTVASVLPACANLAAAQHGREIHDYIIRRGFESDIFVGSALIDMYAKCGSIKVARQVFEMMHQRNIVSWNTMIAGYALHGHGEDALGLFHQMQQEGMTPDHITFTGVLSACSHAGLVDEGWKHFNIMCREYHIAPSVEHCACMVDLLGRAGCLDEAHDFINNMSVEPNACVWGALLGACRIHCNIVLGEHVAKHLFELEPENSGNYVLLSNIFAEAGRWDEVAKVRKMMKDRGVKKRAGCSWIEVKNKVHAFLVGDKSHPQTEKIYAMLESLAGEMKEAGYVSNTNFVLHNLEEEEKEHILCGHSEKLAIAFGLINTCHGVPIRVIKNLRVCGDCHTSTKFISKIVGREIFVRDGSRFHHFKDGLCSCGDYW